ncbi:Cellulose synthase [Dillenia turbinata]|uniref:Cellulose synthase n=1 Tax=Dillenia turbinata TaxID=194707 RepID=A0AAN8VHE5_9MAGN
MYVIGDKFIDSASAAVDQVKMPLLVYVAREKKPSHPHHFKAGALNVLLRVSAVKSNSPHILVLDCDMYCNDPSSARRAMCFHLDPKISPTLAFVQFPQRFHNALWPAWDGLQGPGLAGTGFYIKRKALLGNFKLQEINLSELKNHFGASNKFIKSLLDHDRGSGSSNNDDSSDALQQEMQLLASTSYEKSTKWGEEASGHEQKVYLVGFLYASVVEDYFTGFMLHCKGWTSVYCNPSTPQFLGSSPTSLDTLLVQWTRWACGLLDVGLSRFCPLVYGPPRMSILMSFAYAYVAIFPLCLCVPLWCYATIPQLSLFYGISLFPKASSHSFTILAFIFLSSLLAHLIEVLLTGGSIQTWIYEQQLWMMKTVTSYLYGCLEAIMKKIGMREANFLLTSKAFDDEQVKLYQLGLLDFRTSNMMLVPLVTFTTLNMISFLGGLARVIVIGNWEDMCGQLCLSFYILAMSYPIIEGMLVRKDKGRIPPSVSQISILYSLSFLVLGHAILMY